MSPTTAAIGAGLCAALACAIGLSCAASSVVPAGADHPATARPAAGPSTDAAAAELAAFERARPVFERHCARCHSAGGERARPALLEHFDISRYPFGGHHAESIGHLVREVLGVTGEPPTMPIDRPGAVHGEELDAIVAWTRAFDRAQATGVHGTPAPGHEPARPGAPDAGTHDHGPADAGPAPDAGTHDHGPADAGPAPGAGTHDHDAGGPGPADIGPAPEAGAHDHDAHHHGGH